MTTSFDKVRLATTGSGKRSYSHQEGNNVGNVEIRFLRNFGIDGFQHFGGKKRF